MRDRLNVFGDAVCATSGTAVAAADVLENFSNKQTVGYSMNVNVVAIPSREVAADETITVEILECATESGTYNSVYTYNTTGETILAGDRIQFAFPRVTKKYMKAKASVTKGAATYTSCTVNVAIEIG